MPPGTTICQVVFLVKGSAWTPGETPEGRKIQEGHMGNIRKMAATGKMIAAGPFEKPGDLRGMCIFDGATREEVQAMIEADPAVKAGRLKAEILPWWSMKGWLVVSPPKP